MSEKQKVSLDKALKIEDAIYEDLQKAREVIRYTVNKSWNIDYFEEMMILELKGWSHSFYLLYHGYKKHIVFDASGLIKGMGRNKRDAWIDAIDKEIADA